MQEKHLIFTSSTFFTTLILKVELYLLYYFNSILLEYLKTKIPSSPIKPFPVCKVKHTLNRTKEHISIQFFSF